jgi:hypothetical protein
MSIDRIPTSVRSSLFYPHILWGEDVFDLLLNNDGQLANQRSYAHREWTISSPLWGLLYNDLYYMPLRITLAGAELFATN